MNANSQQKASTINSWLDSAEQHLARVNIPSARLDSELILAYALDTPRTYLHAHTDEDISSEIIEKADLFLDQRLQRIPLAYITGSKEFYGRTFHVSPSVLIPRPESENIINIVRELSQSSTLPENPQIADIGTGSGCLACSIKLEVPSSTVIASDVSSEALEIAVKNASNLGATIDFRLGSLLEPYTETLDCIIANLPYVDTSWDISPETRAEPALALFAEDQGLELIYRLLDEASTRQKTGGYLILESDARQHSDIEAYATKTSYTLVETRGLIQVFRYQ